MGFDKGYLKEYKKCPRCEISREDVWVRENDCVYCQKLSDDEVGQIKLKAAVSSKKWKFEFDYRQALHDRREAFLAAELNPYLAVTSEAGEDERCDECKESHKAACYPCFDKMREEARKATEEEFGT